MLEEKQNTNIAAQQVFEKYPYNLLTAIVGQTDLAQPDTMTTDRCLGLQYALATLEDREQKVISRRFADHQSRSEIGQALGISIERVRQIENKAIIKLRYPARWSYIKLGIEGYMSHRVQEAKRKGFHEGYNAGYQNGVYDTQHGVTLTSQDNEQFRLPIECMAISTRALSCLTCAHLQTIGDVARVSGDQIRTMRNLGKITAAEIAKALQEMGIHHTEWEPYIREKI